MSDSLITSAVTVVMAIVAVAIIAVLVSKNANTAGVIGAGSGGIAQDLGAALSPIIGASPFGSGFTGGAA
jgi:hypothetical protein